MRILGPDGNPIQTGPPVSDEVKQIVERANAIATQQGDPASALQQLVFAFQTDVASDLVLDTTIELLTTMATMTGSDPAQSEELQLFQQLRDKRDDPLLYFQIGNRFFQLQQSFVARPFLARAKELLNGETNELSQAIDVDHAQCLMDLGAYQDAINAFHALNDTYGGLPIWLVLEMSECYALLRQIDEAEAVYQIAPTEAAAQFPGMESVREEVGDLLARVRDFDEVEEMDLRDWHYVQTRGMLLETNPDENVPGERFIFFQPSEEDVAYVVALAAAVLDNKGYAPNRILWLGPNSEPLARLFAQWWEVDSEHVRAYQHGDNAESEEDLGLLVMAHANDVLVLESEEEFIDLAQARAGLITFALDVRWTERQPMTPDIAGFLTQACNLPWETRFIVDEAAETVTRVDETRDPETIALEIAAQFPKDDESDTFATEMLEEYAICTDLILDHRDGELIRRPMVTHSPIKSPRLGF
jgi:tetratricopeptide (TPR) repeat protein